MKKEKNNKKDLIYKTNSHVFNFQQIGTIRAFGDIIPDDKKLTERNQNLIIIMIILIMIIIIIIIIIIIELDKNQKEMKRNKQQL